MHTIANESSRNQGVSLERGGDDIVYAAPLVPHATFPGVHC